MKIYKRVIFPEIRNDNMLVLPDDRGLFRESSSDGNGNIIADYCGAIPLDEYIAPPEYRTLLTRREFMSMFTAQENRAIKNKAKTDDVVDQLWDILISSDTVDLEFEQTAGGMAYLVSVNALSQARHDEIMKGVEV